MKITEQAIRSVISRWRPRFGLDDRWSIDVRTYNEYARWPKSKRGALAYVEPDIAYFKATIHVNLPAFDQYTNSLEEVIVHELAHIVAWPMSVVARDALGKDHESTWEIMMEQMIETFTRALLSKAK